MNNNKDNYSVKFEGKATDVRETVMTSSYALEQLSNEELLAAFLQTGNKSSQLDVANDILGLLPFSKFHEIDRALLKQASLSDKKIASLLAIIELTKRSLADTNDSFSVASSYGLAQKLIEKYGHKEQEHLVALFLNAQNKVIEEQVVFIGSSVRSVAEPKEILKRALRLNATSIIVAHNHPSGNTEPSANDDAFTRKLAKACDTLELILLDHIVIGNGYFSYRESTDIIQ